MNTLRLPFSLLLLLGFTTCTSTKRPPEPVISNARSATIVTVILQAYAGLDSLEVYNIIRGPGHLRTDYARTPPESTEADLFFTYRDAQEHPLRYHALPFPGPNHYEATDEKGEIVPLELPEEERLLILKTQDSPRLYWLDVRGVNDRGDSIRQRIRLRKAG